MGIGFWSCEGACKGSSAGWHAVLGYFPTLINIIRKGRARQTLARYYYRTLISYFFISGYAK